MAEETDEEQTMEEGFLTLEERVHRAQRKIKYAQGLEKEADGLKRKAKELLEIAAEAREESDELILEKPNPQLEIPTTTPAANESTTHPITHCPDGAEHEWQRIRESEGVAMEDCNLCGLERTARVSDPNGENRYTHPSWAYSQPSAATNQDEAAASSDSGETHAPETPVETASAAASPEVPANAG